ncbi:type II secretion system F family protein [Campylobacter sp. faydin G-24]|uniref:Type II secretion system F family protein n=1 Tax=Campylobacter anatolicus TaxID=2829105 RepID=A0ABS5HIU4_9BACT|nr:type II secretion system F family protein [Campylobacter anatolicus]MBR8464053.1 type II secretion system F family protein [Campylobacter anatolicus]
MKIFNLECENDGKHHKITLKTDNKFDTKSLATINNRGTITKIATSKPIAITDSNAQNSKILQNFLSPKIKLPSLIATIRQLSVMSNAGISIHDSIKEVVNSSDDKQLKQTFKHINDELNQGLSLSSAVLSYRQELGDICISMVRLGESTGNIANAFEKLANILDELWQNQQKFKKAIRYPILVITTIIVAFIIMMIAVVPKFREIFEQLNAELPLPTQILLFTQSFISDYGAFILIILVVSGAFIRNLYLKDELFHAKIDTFLLRVYLIGKIIFYSNMSRFHLIFTELVRAGLPITNALDTAIMTLSNAKLKTKLNSVKILIRRGISLTDAFKQTKLYEGMLIQMIGAGEQSGSLDSMLEKISEYYKVKFNEIVDNISSYIEPILLIFITIMVLILSLGIFMPMWDMAQAVKS